MKTNYIRAIAMLALFGIIEPSSAQSGYRFVEGPGEMRAEGQLRGTLTGGVYVDYDLAFRLAEDSDGIYPGAEVVEIEIPGELNPDGSESSAFVISIPVGSFQDGPGDLLHTWNPPGLTVRQQYESYVWDFVGPDGVRRDSTGVRYFWAFIRQRDVGEVNTLGIRMVIRDNRNDGGTAEPAPKFLELMYGGPTLKIGNDGWETQPVRFLRPFRAGPYTPPG